jgi:hypothetical protein
MKKNVQSILPVLPSEVLEKDLKNAQFIKDTERGGNKIYTFSGRECPYLMIQVAILREMSFRNGGGGTGLILDIDRFDEFSVEHVPKNNSYLKIPYFRTLGPFVDQGFKQLIVWDPEQKEIIGGYRYALMADFIQDDNVVSPTIELFNYSPAFLHLYVPYAIELGRSFVQPKYQSPDNRKSLYALNNLFEGLGSLVVNYKDNGIQFFFGKVTMYKTYNRQARNMILYYMKKHFFDAEGLVTPKSEFVPFGLKNEIGFLEKLFVGNTEKEDREILLKSLHNIKEGMPPLFKKYTEMSPTMMCFGTAVNEHCGNVEETAVLVKFDDIVDEYKKRYIFKLLHKK